MKILFPLVCVAVLTTSCNTYYMTPASLTNQLERVNPEKISEAYDFRLGLTGVALKGGKNFYNGIDSLLVTDKTGKVIKLPVTTQLGIRLTDNTGKSVNVYFDSMFKKDSLIFGSKSHFLNLPVQRNISSLSKVEVQTL